MKAEKKAAMEGGARKAGEDVSQMDLDAAAPQTEEEKAKEEKDKKANVEHAEGYFEATDPTIPPVPELKLRYYYRLMIRFHANADDYLEMCRCYQNVMACEGVKENPAEWTPAMKKAVWYVTLAANEPMQQDLMHQISKDPKLADLPLHKQLTKQFTTKEIIHWDTLAEAFAAEMAAEPELFGGEHGEKRRKDLRQRVIEHNLLVIGAYYSRVASNASASSCASGREGDGEAPERPGDDEEGVGEDRSTGRCGGLQHHRAGRGLASEPVGREDGHAAGHP